MIVKEYDVFVIGSGVAGRKTAAMCADSGLRVAISDIREYGGTCGNRGCDPKKIMLQFSEMMKQSKNLKGIGVSEPPTISWADVQNFKKSLLDDLPERVEKILDKQGVDKYYGSLSFIDDHTAVIGETKIKSKFFVIASGLIPRQLKFKGAALLKTSDDILNLSQIPKSVAFIGGGYIGMEFACMLANMGCAVTVIQKSPQVLRQFEPFLVNALVNELEQNQKIKFVFNADVDLLSEKENKQQIKYTTEGVTTTETFDFVVNSSGRVPAIEALKLENTSVKFSAKGVSVNDFMQSVTAPNFYACGDVTDVSVPLTPLSGLQGRIVGNNILAPKSEKFEYPLIPSTVFTSPNLSSVGMSEATALEKLTNVAIYEGNATKWFNAKKSNESLYMYKLIVNEETDQLVGAHLLGGQANEMINFLSTAIVQKMTIADLKRQVYSYPSYTSDIKRMLTK